MLGFCVGVVGLSLTDFEALTPGECDAVCGAYHNASDVRERAAWERTRMTAYSAASPYLKHKTSPQKFLPLPWDNARRTEVQHDNHAAIAELAALCGQ